MIQCRGVSKSYHKGSTVVTPLEALDLDVPKGEFLALMGPSGKTTLLNLLSGIDSPTSGSLVIAGIDIANLSRRELTKWRANHVGYIFQLYPLVPVLTAFENVELPLLYTGMNASARKQKVSTLLEQMKMSHRKDHYPQQLSGGQQQRVAVARAISNDPKIILADEPTGNLDSKHGDEVMRLMMELNEAGTTVVMVTHSQHYARFCRRVIRLLDGKVLTENLKTEHYV